MLNVKRHKILSTVLMLLTLVVFSAVYAQPSLPLYEPFDYPEGNLCGNAEWNPTGSNNVNDVQVVAGSLSYPGLPASTGKKVVVLNGTNYIDPGRDISPVPATPGTSVFYSAIINVTNSGNVTGDYIMHVCSAGQTSTDFHSRLFIRQHDGGTGGYNLGIRNHNADTIQWETIERPVNVPVFVVVSYDFVDGASNDVSRLWINPPLGQETPPTPTLTTIAAGTDLTTVGRINLRQGSGNTSLAVEVDEIRVGTTWQSVTPIAASVQEWVLY